MNTVHIASVIVRARADCADAVADRLARLPGTEVHAVEDGKIIVVLEAEGERELADLMETMRNEPEVLMVSLVFHQEDAEPSVAAT